MNSDGKNIKVSVIMPALNEELNIANAISSTFVAFDLFKIDGEIIVINDGSTDSTQKMVDLKIKESSSKIRVMQHEKPKGIGASFWEGIDVAHGDVIVMLPGDGENDPIEIFRYVGLLEHVDIVIPFIFNKEARSVFRNALSLIYRFIINTTFLVNFNYTNGTVLYRKSVLKGLDYRSHSFFFQTDILVRSVKRGYLFAEVPYKIGARKGGASKAVSFPSFLKVARGYFKLVRDFYFSKNSKIKKGFLTDSVTAKRRNGSD